MLFTRSSIQRRDTNSVSEFRTPVTKLLILLARSSIILGICAIMPTILPKPLDIILDIVPPREDNALPIAPDTALPTLFAIPSPIVGRIESSVPLSASICPTDCCTPPYPSTPCHALALLRAVVNPDVKLATSSDVLFNALPKESIFSRACTVALPSSSARASKASYCSLLILPSRSPTFPASTAATAAASSFLALSYTATLSANRLMASSSFCHVVLWSVPIYWRIC